jgi:hypothetical protein
MDETRCRYRSDSFQRVLDEASRHRSSCWWEPESELAPVTTGTEDRAEGGKGISSDPMSTGAAVRTFNIMLARIARRCRGADRGLRHGRSLLRRSQDICLAMLRDSDRDRYLACLLSPEEKRGALAALYAFNAELARIRDLVHEPLPGEVRMQYWRDLLEGSAHGSTEANPVGSALLTAIETHIVCRARR